MNSKCLGHNGNGNALVYTYCKDKKIHLSILLNLSHSREKASNNDFMLLNL